MLPSSFLALASGLLACAFAPAAAQPCGHPLVGCDSGHALSTPFRGPRNGGEVERIVDGLADFDDTIVEDADGNSYVASGDQVMSVSPAGGVRWRAFCYNGLTARSPVLVNSTVLFIFCVDATFQNFTRVRLSDGRVERGWSILPAGDVEYGTSITISPSADLIIVVGDYRPGGFSGYQRIRAFSTATGGFLWAVSNSAVYLLGQVAFDPTGSRLYYLSSTSGSAGFLGCLNTATGASIFKVPHAIINAAFTAQSFTVH